MGTPDFAVPSLDTLYKAGYDIVGVVTVADKPSGRGRKLRPSPVKVYAESKEIPVLQPIKLRDPEFIQSLASWEADLFVVVAFRMLPEVVWSRPKLGTINLHASLLPDYRGAAPINWVIINGERQTGLTTFLIDKQIDTGNLLLQTRVDIPDNWSAGDLHDEMMEAGAKLLLETVKGLAANKLSPKVQDESLYIHKAPKIFKEHCEIDWNLPAQQVYNFIRGLSPYPAARTSLHGQVMKLFGVELVEGGTVELAGSLKTDSQTQELWVACKDGWLKIKRLQLAGKKQMASADFLRGYKGELDRLGSNVESDGND